MAFDEAYHFGLIQFFSHHLNPFITSQPVQANYLGAIPHNPSILYHYLLSFPYRLIAHFTHSLEIQVIALRFINVAFAVTSLLIIRKIINAIGFSRPLSNILVMLYAFTPIVSQLSAQINYDNLLILLTSLVLLQTVKFRDSWQEGRFDVKGLLTLLALCLFASEVKYAFLPIFVGLVFYIAWLLIAKWRSDRKWLFSSLRAGYNGIHRSVKVALLALIVAGTGMFVYFYGYNSVKYLNPVPQCSQVLSVNSCKSYAPWDRNYVLAASSHTAPPLNALQYTHLWSRIMFYQLFSATSPNGGSELPASHILKDMIVIILALAGICLVFNFQKVAKQYPYLPVLIIITVIYIVSLWLDNYQSYLNLDSPEGIQGRYLLPVLIIMYGVLALSLKSALETRKKPRAVLQLATIFVVAIFLLEGGYKTYVTEVSPSQQWEPNSAIIDLSQEQKTHD